MPDPTAPLSDERLAEIRSTLLGCWYSGEWRLRHPSGNTGPVQIVHSSGQGDTVLAELLDFAVDIAVFIADAHEAVPELLAEVDRLRAVVASLADTVAAWTGDDTPEEDRPGYDGPTIDPADRLLFLLSPEVPGEARRQLIAEHRQMVTGEIAGMLRSLTAAAVVPVSAAPDGGEQ